jgi:hypothetical protein
MGDENRDATNYAVRTAVGGTWYYVFDVRGGRAVGLDASSAVAYRMTQNAAISLAFGMEVETGQRWEVVPLTLRQFG